MQASILSADSLNKRIASLWERLADWKGGNSPLCFSDFIVLWSYVGVDTREENKSSLLIINCVVPNILPRIQKIKNYPFDCDFFRHCVETETARGKYKHLYRISPGGTLQDYRFGYALFLLSYRVCMWKIMLNSFPFWLQFLLNG